METDFVRELVHGTLFIFCAVTALMFAYIAFGAWRKEGYAAVATKASLAFTVFLTGLTATQAWVWLNIWLPRHGFLHAHSLLLAMNWWPILTTVLTISGVLCLIRIFWPIGQDGQAHNKDLVWLIPVLVVLVIKLALALV